MIRARFGSDQAAAGRRACEGVDGLLNLNRCLDRQSDRPNRKCGGDSLRGRNEIHPPAGSQLWIVQNTNVGDGGRNLFKQFDPLAGERRLQEIGKAGEIAARTRKALDEAASNWIGDHREYDGDG